MKSQVELLKKNPRKLYNITEIEELKLIPWARNNRTLLKIIDADKRGANLLRVEIVGVSKGRRYLVPAGGIIKYLQIYGPALIGTVRQKKTYGKTISNTKSKSTSDIQKGKGKSR